VDASFECTNGINCDGGWKKNAIEIVYHVLYLRYRIKWIFCPYCLTHGCGSINMYAVPLGMVSCAQAD